MLKIYKSREDIKSCGLGPQAKTFPSEHPLQNIPWEGYYLRICSFLKESLVKGWMESDSVFAFLSH